VTIEDLNRKKNITVPASSVRLALISSMTGHRSTIFCVAFTKDGKRAVTASSDGFWKIWFIDVELGYTQHQAQLENTFKLEKEITEVLNTKSPSSTLHFNSDISSTGAHVLFSNGRQIYVYSMTSGKLLKKIQLSELILGAKWGRALPNEDSPKIAFDEIVVSLQRNKSLQIFNLQ
jgi:WD40 repeat protein